MSYYKFVNQHRWPKHKGHLEPNTPKRMNTSSKTETPTPDLLDMIKGLIQDGSINAITVDTNIFDEKGRRLNRGLFSQLTQFGRHPVQLVFPDVVLLEMKRHYLQRLKSCKAKFSPELLEAWETMAMDASDINILLKKLETQPALEKICDDQFNRFLQNSKAEVLHAKKYVPIDVLIQSYFGGLPPFQVENPKKSEFPDAIALLALDHWAQRNRTYVLVVSRDIDWKRFCDKTNFLYCVDDLAVALGLLQTPNEIAQSMVKRVYDELQDMRQALYMLIEESIVACDWQDHIRVDADSQFVFDTDGVFLDSVRNVRFPKNPDEYTLTQQTDDSISVAFSAQATIYFSVNFSFFKHDKSEQEYLNMGHTTVNKSVEGLINLTLTMPIALGEISQIRVEDDIETIHVNLGEIDPDWIAMGGYEE
jgi:hypothetical protein